MQPGKTSTERTRAVLARRLRVLRFVRGWSQETLAEVSGLHRTYVSAIERGRCNLSLTSMTKLADALGVTLVELLDSRGGVEELDSHLRGNN